MNETVAAVGPWLEYLDLAGIAFFALSGALVAAAKRQTLVTFIFFAVITGVGGGTVRDLLICAPVFWLETNVILFICLAAGLIVWFLPDRVWRGRALARESVLSGQSVAVRVELGVCMFHQQKNPLKD